ncbi:MULTISPECIES: S8 family serine peptidase [unclassified Phenylobacterium]|uniref:subtilisin-like serine protease QhpE n=1 Tax=unclassified Phenylobacterium TaxID=2640670 RepID=UPI000B29E992|nr:MULTISPECIES: S8 family serine peptidase [unclassified Phenylobacterium]
MDEFALAPLAGLTGRNVAIAVIDSGVHPTHDHIAADRLGAGAMVLPDGAVVEGEDVWLDRLGHGTAVTAAIQEKAPDALCIPVRVFRDALKTSAAALIGAIRWAVAREVQVINLSLGSVNAAHSDAFAAVADEAVAAGVVIVAAHRANDAPCYPGSLAQVVGVDVDWDCPRTGYGVLRSGDAVVLRASGYPRPIPGVPARRNLYGVSFAVAQVSGFVARACEARPSDLTGPEAVQRVRDILREPLSCDVAGAG